MAVLTSRPDHETEIRRVSRESNIVVNLTCIEACTALPDHSTHSHYMALACTHLSQRSYPPPCTASQSTHSYALEYQPRNPSKTSKYPNSRASILLKKNPPSPRVFGRFLIIFARKIVDPRIAIVAAGFPSCGYFEVDWRGVAAYRF